MRFGEIIARKRDGHALTAQEIHFFVSGVVSGTLPDYQIAALLMAITLRGMTDTETDVLTDAMAESGETIDLSAALPPGKPTLDKHSTGGVGDKTSLIVVPVLAAVGIAVCKMSGRGLGHTGGTLDKLESIPGFRVERTTGEMLEQVAGIGACLVGQSAALAPADKKLYALRDATETVGSPPLIVSSILSKKLAGGASALLFDVKVGNGAFLPGLDEARTLATALVRGGARHGKATVALLTDMNQPLGRTIGNALEVGEAIQMLTPTETQRHDPRLRELCLALATEGILLAGVAADAVAARALATENLDSGRALAVFRQIVAAQNGDPTAVDHPEKLPAAPVVREVPAPATGYIAAISAAALGSVVVRMGGGRERKEDSVDSTVGLELCGAVGTYLRAGEPLLRVHAHSDDQAMEMVPDILAAYRFSTEPVPIPPLILETVS